jgi:hypothetical protein
MSEEVIFYYTGEIRVPIPNVGEYIWTNRHLCLVTEETKATGLFPILKRREKGECHLRNHKELHKGLEELVIDMFQHTEKLPSKTSLKELFDWSLLQTKNPTETT